MGLLQLPVRYWAMHSSSPSCMRRLPRFGYDDITGICAGVRKCFLM